MLRIPLTKVPNQKISFNAGGSYWQLSIYSLINNMGCDVSRNGNVLFTGQRLFGGFPVIPYEYMWKGNGNFIFDGDVDWENFGGSLNLYYLSDEEMAAYQSAVNASYAI